MKWGALAPNGLALDGIIDENPDNFALYKLLKLDVFETVPEKKANVIEPELAETSKKKRGRSN